MTSVHRGVAVRNRKNQFPCLLQPSALLLRCSQKMETLPPQPLLFPSKRQVLAVPLARAPELPDTTPLIGRAHEFYGKTGSLL